MSGTLCGRVEREPLKTWGPLGGRGRMNVRLQRERALGCSNGFGSGPGTDAWLVPTTRLLQALGHSSSIEPLSHQRVAMGSRWVSPGERGDPGTARGWRWPPQSLAQSSRIGA